MLELRHITKVYRKKRRPEVYALRDISLTFPEKGMVFIVGKSGSGKSTLLHILGGLDKATSGELIVDGKSSASFKDKDFDSYRNYDIGFVFQEYNLLPQFTVEENIALALELQGKKNDKETVQKLLKEVDLEGLEKRKPYELSGGQKQRVAIARALIKDPKVILADEPTGALDSETGKQVLDTLKNLSKDRLVILVSHDIEYANTYADRIIELKDGKVISDKTKEDIAKEKTIDTEITSPNAIIKNGYEKNLRKGSHLPFSKAFRFALSSMKTKPFRLVMTSILSILALVFLGLCSDMMFYNRTDVLAQSLADSSDAYISITKQYRGTPETEEDWSALEDTNLSDSDIEEIQNEYGDDVIYYSDLQSSYRADRDLYSLCIANSYDAESFQNNGDYFHKWYLTGFAYVNEDNPFIKDHILSGSYPSSAQEVMISSYTFESLQAMGAYDESGISFSQYTKDTAIGKKLYFDAPGITYTDEDEKPGYTISGIYDVDYLIDEKFRVLADEESQYDNIEEYYAFNTIWPYHPASLVLVSENFFEEEPGRISLNRSILPLYQSFTLADKTEITYGIVYPSEYFSLVDSQKSEAPTGKEISLSSLALGNYIRQSVTASDFTTVDSETGHSPKEECIAFSSGKYSSEEEKLSEEERKACFQRVYSYLKEKGLASTLFENLSLSQGNLSEKVSIASYYFSDQDSLSLSSDLYTAGFSFLRQNEYDPKEDARTKDYTVDPYARYSGVIIPNPHSTLKIRWLAERYDGFEQRHWRYPIKAEVVSDIDNSEELMQNLYPLFLTIGLLAAFFAALLLATFLSASIANRKREIGLLRALGAEKKDVFLIYFLEASFLSLIYFILAVILNVYLASFINSQLTAFEASIFVFTYKSALLLFLLTAIVAFLATLIPVLRYSRKPPVESLRSI